MHDVPQRLSVVLEHEDEDNEWAVVSLLITEGGNRRRATLGRFAKRTEAAQYLNAVFAELPKKKKAAS